MSSFVDFPLKMLQPKFDSNLTGLIIDLDNLRTKRLFGSTPPYIFFQIKNIFQTLESIGSARIEGNNTTVFNFLESKLDKTQVKNQSYLEIENIENCMQYIEKHIEDCEIDKRFINDLHSHIVKGLTPPPNGEGDHTPGSYRTVDLSIAQSNHQPPSFLHVAELMANLFKFISKPSLSRYDLLKVAIAHHRFVWVHPYGNGNGRTVRLLTYAMLVKAGFNINVGRIVNPTAIFCSDRNLYYNYLAKADTGTENGMIEWCEYVLGGLKNEVAKIDKLLNYEFLKANILLHALNEIKQNGIIDLNEWTVLKLAVEKTFVVSQDLQSLMPKKLTAAISRDLRRLREKNFLRNDVTNTRENFISFNNIYFLKAVIKKLDENGFLPVKVE